METAPELSLFLPVLNEEENLRPMHAKIQDALKSLGKTAEVIYVDDGSTDASLQILKEIAAMDDRVRVISLRRNYGQTAAMSAGIDAAKGEILIPMDADLQNDPKDISRLLDKLNEGYDVVSGWRKNRKDALVLRKIPSQIANSIISWIGGVPLHDYGCSLKAYRREVIQDVKLYGEMHRFIPIYASWAGARVTEIPVDHHARTMGKSKYGISRTIKVVFDLMTIKFMASYQTKPIYVFGTFGMIAFFLSIFAGLWAFVLKFGYGVSFILTPLPVIAIVMLAISMQFFLMGLLPKCSCELITNRRTKRSTPCAKKLGLKMDKEKINKLIEFLEQVLKYPAMHFGKVDDVERANSFLIGIRYATFHLFSLDSYSIVTIMRETTTRRNHKFTPRGAVQDLRDEGFEDTQIVTELIETEIDFWKLVRDNK